MVTNLGYDKQRRNDNMQGKYDSDFARNLWSGSSESNVKQARVE